MEANPNYVYAHANLCDLYAVLAQHNCTLGIDPSKDVERAVEAGTRALELDVSWTFSREAMARALLALATYRLESNLDPTEQVSSVREQISALEKADPENAIALRIDGATYLVEARWAARASNASELFRQGEQVLRHSLETAPEPATYLVLADTYRWWGQLVDGPDEVVERGIRAADEAIRLGRRPAAALVTSAALLTIRAERQDENRGHLLDQAASRVEEAMSANRHLAGRCGALLRKIRDAREPTSRT